MEREKLESLLIDYLDNKLGEEERTMIEVELQTNLEAQKLLAQLKEVLQEFKQAKQLQPTPLIQLKFEQALRQEIANEKRSKRIFMSPIIYRAAAAIGFVVIGVGIGLWINNNNTQARELAEIKAQMEATKKMLITMLDNNRSASQRVQGATIAYTMTSADDEVVKALGKALNEDPNTNVRLAALDALGKFYQEAQVRKVLIQSLTMQKDEVVQIALIQLLVQMKEKGIVKDLEKITKDNQVLKAVKDEAFTGILKLS